MLNKYYAMLANILDNGKQQKTKKVISFISLTNNCR